jgi:hypothetical protein
MTLLTNPDIDDIETQLGHTLPGLYRKLLVMEGHGELVAGAVIYHPAEVRGQCEAIFDEPGQLFDPYWPFGYDSDAQELWVINAATERAASIWHETHPDDWWEEEWLPYEVWVERYLDPMVAGSAGS